jgi:hypothetical protein
MHADARTAITAELTGNCFECITLQIPAPCSSESYLPNRSRQ